MKTVSPRQLQWLLPGALALLSPIVPLSVRYLTFHYDVFTINAFRMTAGAAGLLILAAIYHRDELKRTFTNRRQALLILLISLCSLLAQHAVTEGIRLTPAVMSQLINALGLPLTILLAFIFFQDERALARKPGFWIGAILSVGGTIGIALAGHQRQLDAQLLGIFYLLAAVVLWVIVGLMVKGVGDTMPALVVGGVSALVQGIVFLVLTARWCHPQAVLQVSAFTNIVLVLSGTAGMLVGTGLGFIVAQRSGVIVYQTTNLIIPILTGIMGYLLFRETLQGPSLLFGGLLILGSAIIIRFAEYHAPEPVTDTTLASTHSDRPDK